MNIILEKKNFTEYIQLLEKVSGKQLNLEVLKCIRIEATPKNIILQATNLDIGIQVTLPSKTKKTGVENSK